MLLTSKTSFNQPNKIVMCANNLTVYWKHSCSPVKSLLFCTLARVGLINMSIKAAQQCSNLCMQSRSHVYHRSREREASVLDHKGCNSNGTNEERCLLMRLKHQPKQSLDGGTIFMRGCLSLCCPARPGTFLITIQSLSVYTISGAE